MSNPIKDGGPAFPAQPIETIPGVGSIVKNQGGMTLRDYFAGKALAAIISKQPPIYHDTKAVYDMAKANAVGSYIYADAMIAAREAKP